MLNGGLLYNRTAQVPDSAFKFRTTVTRKGQFHYKARRHRFQELIAANCLSRVWERLLNLVQQRGVALGMAFLDGTTIRAHQKAAGADKRGADGEQRDRRE